MSFCIVGNWKVNLRCFFSVNLISAITSAKAEEGTPLCLLREADLAD